MKENDPRGTRPSRDCARTVSYVLPLPPDVGWEATAAAHEQVLSRSCAGVHLDPATYLGMSGLLLLMVAIASWVPGRRAARIDPVAALRSQ